ncbi:cathepsin L1-like [Colossoma macropomum]|uniref:cathepsin L1-like n=1 Tax=Colossoma macropomum TaxID=42526 RepID=UPI0018653545|nr:cathepsin L1-like [Colossoma macropomum]
MERELTALPPRHCPQLAARPPGSNVMCSKAASLCIRGRGSGSGPRDSFVPLMAGTIVLLLPSAELGLCAPPPPHSPCPLRRGMSPLGVPGPAFLPALMPVIVGARRAGTCHIVEGRCKFKNWRAWAKCSGYRKGQHTERALRNAVATIGPISVAIDVSRHSFQFYKSGVYDEPACSSTKVTHAVLVVGYGTDRCGKDYWLVKNSWGTGWGDKGYIKMSRNKRNQCGIASYAYYSVV